MLTRAVNILKVGQLVSAIDPTIAQTKKNVQLIRFTRVIPACISVKENEC